MKKRIRELLVILSVLLIAGCFANQKSTNNDRKKKVNSTTEKTNNMDNAKISKKDAIKIAKKAIADLEYDKSATIKVELRDNKYIIIFPIKKITRPGTSWIGPDYAAKVIMDVKGKIIKILCGS